MKKVSLLKNLRRNVIFLVLFCVLSVSLHTAAVYANLVNASFEHPTLADGGYEGDFAKVNGWKIDAAGFGYVEDKATANIPQPTNGSNFLYSYTAGEYDTNVAQDTSLVIKDKTVYTFSADVNLYSSIGELVIYAWDDSGTKDLKRLSLSRLPTSQWHYGQKVFWDSTSSEHVGKKIGVRFDGIYGYADNCALDTSAPRPASAPDGKTSVAYLDNGATIVFGNGIVELTLVSKTGFIRNITNKVSGREYKLANDGSWPFGMELGFPNVPKFLTVEIVANTPHPQSMTHKTVSVDGGKVLKLKYDNLLSSGGALTGIKMAVDISLQDGADYFLIKADIDNKSKYYINNLYSGTGGLVAADTRQEETLIVPGWDYGKVYSNPHGFFKERETYGYPIFASSCALTTGWLDLLGPDGGIGIGYLNRQGLTMLFNVQQASQGLNVNWQFFNLVHNASPWGHVGGIFGLAPGKSFTTDQWIVAPHNGDWHRMADIYRGEYEKAFAGTFLNETNNNPVAEKIDFANSTVIYNERSGKPAKKFEEIIPFVKGVADAVQTKPENILTVLLGQDQHWPHRMPDFYPANTDAGGNEGLKKMISELSDMGMDALLLYGHAFYNHPKANDYVAEADTGYDHLNRAWPEIGNVACLGSKEWHNLWKQKYIPGFADLGAAGVYWDQGPAQYLVCPLPKHSHGKDKIKQLASHTKGILQLQEEFREIYARKKMNSPIFWVEVSSDLTGRTMDIWTTTPGYYNRGGVMKKEIVRYAVPYHLCAEGAPAKAVDVNYTFVNGFICWPNTNGPADVMDAQRQFSKLRRELRSTKAPGFPYGFKDTIGLKTSDPNLVARSYRSDDGISILYFAKEPLEGDITIDTSELGFAGKGIKTFTVNLKKNQAGYELIRL